MASRNRARSTDGTGAVIRRPPGKIESHRRQVGKPAILVSNSPIQAGNRGDFGADRARNRRGSCIVSVAPQEAKRHCFDGLGKTVAEHREKGMNGLAHGRIHYTKWIDNMGNDG